MAQPRVVFLMGVFVLVSAVVGCKKTQANCGEDASAITTIPIDQPKAATGGEVESVVKVTLLVDGSILLNGKKVTGDELRSQMIALRQKTPEVRATIEADGDVPHKKVIYVLDVLKQSGVAKIAFGVVPAPAPAPR